MRTLLFPNILFASLAAAEACRRRVWMYYKNQCRRFAWKAEDRRELLENKQCKWAVGKIAMQMRRAHIYAVQ